MYNIFVHKNLHKEGERMDKRKIEGTDYSLADFYELPDKDIFAKTKELSIYLDDFTKRGHNSYRRTLLTPCDHRVTIWDDMEKKKKEMIMMGSNNYLGLVTHPKVVEAGIRAYEKWGMGAGGVPLLSGTLDLLKELEYRLAKMKGCEDAVVFNSGYSMNLGTISALVRKGDVAINDKLNHASIIDGSRFADGDMRIFKHNDMEHLEKMLRYADNKYNGKLIIVDSVFSMDGDIAPMPDIKKLADRYGAKIMIDEAHSTGVMGKNGRGIPEYFNMWGKIDIVAGTLSKALAGVGGFAATTKEVANYIRLYARSYFFSTALPPATLASLIAGIDVIENEPKIRKNLWNNINYMRINLKKMGYNTQNSETAIIPIIIGDNYKLREMNKAIAKAGIFLNPVPYPAVPKKLSRLRISLMATHTQEDLDTTLEVLEKTGKEFGIIE